MARKEKRTSLAPLTIAVVAVATPATIALSLYALTGDVRWRPLALTLERTWYSEFDHDPLTVIVYWPTDRDPAGGTALADQVRKAIRARGIHAKVTVVGIEGQGRVVYRVGQNLIGPYNLATAAIGVDGAVAAYWRQTRPETG